MIEAHFQHISSLIYKELDKATESIDIAMYFFTNKLLFEKLMEKADKGVKISLIIHDNYINLRYGGINFQRFADNENCRIYISTKEKPIHDKFCVIDSKTLISGSYNWTYAAENYNKENIMMVVNEKDGPSDERRLVNSYIDEYNRLTSDPDLKQRKVMPRYSRNEIDEYYTMDGKEYLMQDLIYEAAEMDDKEKAGLLAKEAISLNPDNIKIQKKAAELKLIPRRKLGHSIGIKCRGNKFLVLAPKGAELPYEKPNIYTATADDNQIGCYAYFYYGEDKNTKNDTPIRIDDNGVVEREKQNHLKTYVSGLEPRPAGKVEFAHYCNIGFDGIMRVTMLPRNSKYDKEKSIVKIEPKDLNGIDGMIVETMEEDLSELPF